MQTDARFDLSALTPAPPRTARLLLALYVVYFIILGIAPYDRTVWVAENVPILLIAGTLAATYRRFAFSTTAYALMGFLVFLHTLGGHFTFALVPFDWVTDWFGFSRNHYDRIAHFTVGFYAWPLAEFLLRRNLTRARGILLFFPVSAILAVAALYEIFEWQYAVLGDPAAGIAVLGSQGDVWDAQRDMLADGLGAVTATLFFLWRTRPRR